MLKNPLMIVYGMHPTYNILHLIFLLNNASHKEEITVGLGNISRDEQMVIWSIIDFSMDTNMIKDLEFDSKKEDKV